MDEIVRQMAPRSFFMTNGLKDGLFPISGIERIKEDAADEYNRRGIDDNFISIIFDDEHKFREQEKKIAYPWLDERLKP